MQNDQSFVLSYWNNEFDRASKEDNEHENCLFEVQICSKKGSKENDDKILIVLGYLMAWV